MPISKGELEWRRKQKPGSTMSTTNFNKLVKKNTPKYGKATSQKIAGKIYWEKEHKQYLDYLKRKRVRKISTKKKSKKTNRKRKTRKRKRR